MEEEKKKSMKEPLLQASKGGFKILPFIIANEALEKVASFGLLPNMILYLMKVYKMESSEAATVLFFWAAASNFFPVFGAVLGDSYVGRYPMIAFGSVASLMGMVLLWLTTIVPQLNPLLCECDQTNNNCTSPSSFQLMFLYSSFALMSIGGASIRSCSLAFGADQIDNNDNKKMLESYFSWYYVSSAVAGIVAMTVVVYVQDRMGWEVGFGVPVMLMCVSAVSFFFASPFYYKREVNTSLLPGLARVVACSYKNRNVELPAQDVAGLYYKEEGSLLRVPSQKLRFLNKACIIRKNTNPGKICTVNQVEELKSLIKLIPIWSSCLILPVLITQNFAVLELSSMDRHITPTLEIPAGSFGAVLVISLTLWITLYDRIILPVASSITGRPVRLGVKKRIGAGLIFSTLSVAAIAIAERVRRETAIREGFSDHPEATVSMSAMWMLPHYVLGGLAEGFNVIGQIELYYSELPRSMSSLASALVVVGMSVGSVAASVVVSVVDGVSGRGGRESWVSSNINKGRYDYYYWVLAGLSLVNFLYFLACSKGFGCCATEGGDKVKVLDGEDNVGESLVV